MQAGNVLRVYPWGEAPENVARPYATYGVYNGVPENYLGQVPDVDNLGTQIDVWADTAASGNACAIAIRDSLEPHAHMTSFAANERDGETKLYRCRMSFDFYKERA
jgi:hypothetical protein